MKVLLDTCVLSELWSPQAHPGVKAAVAELADGDLFLSVLTLGEIAKGVTLLAAGRKKKALTSWLNGLETKFGDRILAIDVETARLWGELTALAQKAGEIIPAVDGLLAATALSRRDPQHAALRGERGSRPQPLAGLMTDPYPNYESHLLDERHRFFTGRLPDELGPDATPFAVLWNLHPDDYHVIKIPSRLVKTPRWQQAYGRTIITRAGPTSHCRYRSTLSPCSDGARARSTSVSTACS